MVGDEGHALPGALDGVFADQVKLYCKETSSEEKEVEEFQRKKEVARRIRMGEDRV